MANLLLLYDTKEKDLVRDFKDLLEEFNIGSLIMIPLSSDKGFTLEAKERHYFDSAEGALFVITPGSERLGSLYPSPSVTHEMGQAKQRFQKKPESVIYLVDKLCQLPAIDQKVYISFDRNDIRSVIAALTQLIKNLKSASLFRTTPFPTQNTQPDRKFDLGEFSMGLGDQIRSVLFDMSNRPNGYISDVDLTALLNQKYKLNVQDINFLKRDLESFNVVIHSIVDKPFFANSWWLHDVGWGVVRLEAEKKKKTEREAMNNLAKALAQGGILGRKL